MRKYHISKNYFVQVTIAFEYGTLCIMLSDQRIKFSRSSSVLEQLIHSITTKNKLLRFAFERYIEFRES